MYNQTTSWPGIILLPLRWSDHNESAQRHQCFNYPATTDAGALTLHIDVTSAHHDLVDQSGGMVIHFFLFVFVLGLPEKRYMVNGYGE